MRTARAFAFKTFKYKENKIVIILKEKDNMEINKNRSDEKSCLDTQFMLSFR